jgi:hypothetical protein
MHQSGIMKQEYGQEKTAFIMKIIAAVNVIGVGVGLSRIDTAIKQIAEKVIIWGC